MDPHRATPKPKVFISYAHEGDLRELSPRLLHLVVSQAAKQRT
ncbi:MAG: hypothetical protein ACK583_10165 [Cyanobacteriota bacterium]